MKLRNKLAAITAAAMLAFAGIGFASWTFTNEVSLSSSISATDKVAVAVEMDETFGLKAYAEDTYVHEVSALYLICDAPTGKDYVLGGNGVYWAANTGTNESPVYTPISKLYIKGLLNYDAEDGVLPVSTVDVTFTVDNTLASNTYITIDSTSTVGGVVPNIAVSNGAVVAYTLVLPTVSYVEAQIPHSVEDVTTMNTYLSTHLTGSIQVSAQITDKAE